MRQLSLALSLSLFKIKALHCTPLEFTTGFLAGAFNLKVATVRRERQRESGVVADGEATLGSTHSQHHVMYEMRRPTADNRGVFIPQFLAWNMQQDFIYSFKKTHKKGTF